MKIPLSLLTALLVQQLCQLIKFAVYSLRDRRLSPGYLTSSGGMPSAHSAFVTSLAVSVGMRAGFGSEVFSVALVLAFIVIHDALRVRGALQRLILIVKADHPDPDHEAAILPATIGHSAGEVVAGVVLATLLTVPTAMLLG